MNHLKNINSESGQLTELEYKIRQAKKNLQDIFDGNTDAIVIIDKNREIKRVNKSLIELVGKESYHEVLGKRCFELFCGTDKPCEGCLIHSLFENGKKQTLLRSFEVEPLKRRIFQVTVFPLYSDQEDHHAIVKYIRDVTKEINNEKRLLELEKAQNMRFLAAGVAHELRNPLAIIKSSAQLCIKELGKLSSPKLSSDFRENLEAIVNSANNSSQTVKHLMDFSKPLNPTFEMADIGSIIDEVCNMIKIRCHHKEINLSKSISPAIPSIKLDRSSLIQAILNFITNAIDVVSVGGDVVIEVTYRTDAEFIYIFIKDTGKGVSELVADHVFEPFFTTKEEGAGLGMTVAHRIINAHGGTVDFESKEDKGSIVTIKLPVKESFTARGA
ncbi:MAG: ATP-binding protein [Pseudomonadota bacterium]